jgi:hypothetical protein
MLRLRTRLRKQKIQTLKTSISTDRISRFVSVRNGRRMVRCKPIKGADHPVGVNQGIADNPGLPLKAVAIFAI